MPDFIADIHVPALREQVTGGEHLDVGLGNWGRPQLALALGDRGIEAVFSRGPDA